MLAAELIRPTDAGSSDFFVRHHGIVCWYGYLFASEQVGGTPTRPIV